VRKRTEGAIGASLCRKLSTIGLKDFLVFRGNSRGIWTYACPWKRDRRLSLKKYKYSVDIKKCRTLTEGIFGVIIAGTGDAVPGGLGPPESWTTEELSLKFGLIAPHHLQNLILPCAIGFSPQKGDHSAGLVASMMSRKLCGKPIGRMVKMREKAVDLF
jgi:hypothetical protein